MSALALARTVALRRFKSATGQNNHFIVTILVGLNQVEHEDFEPDADFSSQWSPRNRVSSARRSREYALQTSLTWIVDQLNSLRYGLLATPTAFSDSERSRIQAHDSARDKLDELLNVLGVPRTSDYRMCELAITWRNRSVHSGPVERKINSSLKRNLLAVEARIADQHRGLAISDCISAYERGDAPPLKAVASFVQAAQSLATALDEAVVHRVSTEGFAEEAIRTWAVDRSGTHGLTKTWGGSAEQTRRRIVQLLISAGMHEVDDAHARAMDAQYFEGLLALSPAQAKARFLPVASGDGA
jgi:hypothetical protein